MTLRNTLLLKKYLLGFGMERLEQTGKSYIVNGEKIKARKKTNNKWFETQDSRGYYGVKQSCNKSKEIHVITLIHRYFLDLISFISLTVKNLFFGAFLLHVCYAKQNNLYNFDLRETRMGA